MQIERITILLLKEHESLEIRKIYTEYFRHTGRSSVYLIPPSIILGKESKIESHIPLLSTFTLSGDIETNNYGTYLSIEEDDAIKEIDDALNLEYMKTGLNIDLEKSIAPFSFTLKEIRVDAIAIAEFDDNSFKIIKKKRLSMGK